MNRSILLGDGDHLLENPLRPDGSGGVVRVDDQDAGDGRVVLDRQAQVVEVGIPVVGRVEAIADRPLPGVGGFTGGMGGIGRRGADDAGFAAQQAVDFLDGVAQAVEEDDVVRRDLRLAAAVGHLGEELAGLQDSLGGAVAVGAVLHGQVGDDLLHPLGDDFALGDRVADVLHVGLDAEGPELVGDLDDRPDLVGQFSGADMNDVVAHVLVSFPSK